MLKVKKIDKKKFIIYLIIIIFMFSGALFFVYKNYQLTKPKKIPDIFIDENNQPIVSASIKKEDIYNEIKRNINNLNLLKSDNYKNLVDNKIEPLKINPGNQNPFEYYE